jgi:hypothetical protein
MDPIEEFYAKHYAKLSEFTEHYKRRLNLTYGALRNYVTEPFFSIGDRLWYWKKFAFHSR